MGPFFKVLPMRKRVMSACSMPGIGQAHFRLTMRCHPHFTGEGKRVRKALARSPTGRKGMECGIQVQALVPAYTQPRGQKPHIMCLVARFVASDPGCGSTGMDRRKGVWSKSGYGLLGKTGKIRCPEKKDKINRLGHL